MVQWFERARFELHPENAPPYNLLLGLLGNEIRARAARPTGQQSNGESLYPPISYDGRYVAFLSGATNLVEGDTNAVPDVFVHDRGLTARSASLGAIAGDAHALGKAALPVADEYVWIRSRVSGR